MREETMKKNQMPLTLKETIVLDGNAGLKELRSLSFEPSVSITEHADHILIEGSLHLAGEGVASLDSRFEEQDYVSYERVQVINHAMDEQLEFEHYFPITVNVASSRVENVHLLDVYIDHIDYELKDDRLLSIQADIIVDGVSKFEATVPVAEVNEADEKTVQEVTKVEREEEIHELPIRLLPNPLHEWNGQTPIEQEVIYDLDNNNIVSDQAENQIGKQKNQDEEIPNYQGEIVQEAVYSEMRATQTEELLEENETAELIEDTEYDEEDLERYEDQEPLDDQALMSFVSLLEEDMTTIKIHIAQQDETPEMVAERYGVTMVQLMKTNQFESRAPFERGKLVWIP